jgi:hypothetical protein
MRRHTGAVVAERADSVMFTTSHLKKEKEEKKKKKEKKSFSFLFLAVKCICVCVVAWRSGNELRV